MIETERLIITPASDEEMLELIENETDEGLKIAYGEMLAGCREYREERIWYAAWIIRLKDGTMTGDLGFKGMPHRNRVEIGYGLLPEYRGMGYASEAVRAAVDWALKQPGVKAVAAETEPDNTDSQRVLKKAGFVPTGFIGEEGPRFIKVKI